MGYDPELSKFQNLKRELDAKPSILQYPEDKWRQESLMECVMDSVDDIYGHHDEEDVHTFPHVGVVNIVIKHHDVLMQRRGTHADDGQWGFPGGKLELWESFVDCANRERIEECGEEMKVTGPRVWVVKNTLFRHENKHFVVIFTISRWQSGEPINMEPDKGGDWEWHNWNNLPQPLMPGIQMLLDEGEYPILL